MYSKIFPVLTAILSVLLGLMSQLVQAQSVSDITDLILVTGQSNVRGSQTAYSASLDVPDLRVFAYTDSNDWEVSDLHQAWDVDGWHPGNGSLADNARSPYNNFAFHFAKTIVENDPDKIVGIIIASAPGEGIQHWDANGPFSQTVESKVLAALNAQGAKSQIDGIIWHQGETDWQFSGTSDVDATDAERSDPNYYPTKLNALINRYRTQNWFDSNRPFICGETRQAPVNERLMALNSDNDPWTGCVVANDLPTREQNLQTNPPVLGTHFNAAGLRTLGRRYASKYLEMTNDAELTEPTVDVTSPDTFTSIPATDGSANGTTATDAADTTDPTAEASIPADGSLITPRTTDITGTLFDADSGANRVRVRIRQIGVSPSLYWNGSVWTDSATWRDATLNSNATSWTLPNVDLTNPGNYRVQLLAYDNAGNIASASENPVSVFSVGIVDNTDPLAETTSAADGNSLAQSTLDVTGTLFDADSGANRVRVRIRQIGVSPSLYWNGSVWTDSATWRDATLNSNATSWTLPNVDLTNPGNYRVQLLAYDNAGNIASASENPVTVFSVD